MGADGILQLVPQAVDEFLVVACDLVRLDRGGEMPPRLSPHATGGVDGQAVPRRQDGDAPVDGARGGDAEPGEVFPDGGGVDLARHAAAGEQGVELGGEDQARVRQPGVVERLDAQRIAGGEEGVLPRVPDGEGEHPAQAWQAGRSVGGVGSEQHLGVAVGMERPAGGGEFGLQLGVVVDRAVEDEGEAPVGARHRLVPVGRVDDREPAHADGGIAGGVEAAVVRPAVDLALHHARYGRLALRLGEFRGKNAGYAAHSGLATDITDGHG